MRVVIVGAGIGGLATALELHRVGIDATLLEQGDADGETGVGFDLLPHAVRLLARLGLLDGLDGDPPPHRQDWSRPGDPAVDHHALVAATPVAHEFPMCDRDPLPRWAHGRVTLLGDAAHPMYPMGSNGAEQAILDAEALAEHLTAADPDTALAAYEAERVPVTADVVRRNRRGGPEGVIDEVERRAPDGFDALDDVIPGAELGAMLAAYATATGATPQQVRGR